MNLDNENLTWHALGQASELINRKASEFVIGERIIAVLADGDNIYAIDSVCAHQGGPLAKGFVADGCVTCPWHGWQYRLKDGCNTVTKKKMLDTYPTRIVSGQLEIGISAS